MYVLPRSTSEVDSAMLNELLPNTTHSLRRRLAYRAVAAVMMYVLPCSTSEVDPAMLNELLSDISPRFRPQDYSLLTHNCNHFSNELVQLLTGESVPVGACEHHSSMRAWIPAQPLVR
jgi:hypothetical protein